MQEIGCRADLKHKVLDASQAEVTSGGLHTGACPSPELREKWWKVRDRNRDCREDSKQVGPSEERGCSPEQGTGVKGHHPAAETGTAGGCVLCSWYESVSTPWWVLHTLVGSPPRGVCAMLTPAL